MPIGNRSEIFDAKVKFKTSINNIAKQVIHKYKENK